LGDERSLDESPACLCDAGESDDGLSVVLVSCLFLWDCWIFSPTGSVAYVSHDEYGELFEPDRDLRRETAKELERRGLAKK
jgi:hypothetical protein